MQLLTKKQAAKLFEITPRCFDLWIAKGKMPKGLPAEKTLTNGKYNPSLYWSYAMLGLVEPAPVPVPVAPTVIDMQVAPEYDYPVQTGSKPDNAELAEILRDAEARGCLIQGHPDLKPPSPESAVPRYVPVRSFHVPPTAKHDPHTMGPQPQKSTSGYSNPVDDPAFEALHAFKGFQRS